MVEAEGLTVQFARRVILRGIDFAAKAGGLTVIAGPNGSGKTTLLKALCGDLPHSGTIRLNGRDIRGLKAHQMADRRGVLAQETKLSFPFTVSEVVRIGISALGEPSDRHVCRKRRVAEALAAVDLEGFAGRFYQELSGGERQRVQLARVLCQIWEPVDASGPRWLFLDEPVSSLDIRHQIGVMELAADYARRGGGVIAVMHDLNLTAMFANHVVLLSRGQVVASGPPQLAMTDAALSETFGCQLRVGAKPSNDLFVLPHLVTGAAIGD
ncbi:heme ABC transporter ATP-binding protein [Pseudohoeflea coraliihabitans]|uniref:Heme ABC transporter ATP-binding protein n=1 Tax=Pseudohoeflea coraliihabitans TaxID=2860393 RepID=A0ABS6WP24_9HYPH|nr:heme ABC transporter ATP-binding protein [Pseudohoeflea sp. DP4N28-3]MBW3097706.1 heme ABC transporter ATP-binding protein [Pseudohoeflea sp. DP4N28-3]